MAEVLSQSQIDALLNSMRSGGDAADKAEEKQPEKKYRKYDYTTPESLPRTGSKCSTAFSRTTLG